MKLPKSILVPTDFSRAAEHALDYALGLAEKLDATVHVMHAYVAPALLWPEAPVSAEAIEAIETASRKALRDLASRKQVEGVRLETHLEIGDPRMVLESSATALHVDLICMGTHGRRGLSRLLLGSVAEYTVRTSKVPVLTLREASEE